MCVNRVTSSEKWGSPNLDNKITGIDRLAMVPCGHRQHTGVHGSSAPSSSARWYRARGAVREMTFVESRQVSKRESFVYIEYSFSPVGVEESSEGLKM